MLHIAASSRVATISYSLKLKPSVVRYRINSDCVQTVRRISTSSGTAEKNYLDRTRIFSARDPLNRLVLPTINIRKFSKYSPAPQASGPNQDGSNKTSSSNDSPPSDLPTADERSVAMWLLVLCGMVFVMVLLGGATRLTESGLSITEWKPFKGARPPLSEEDWQHEFDKYRLTPEFVKLHSHMNLEDFKFIYLMEWGHRQWGRVIGLAYLVPFLYFLKKGVFKNKPKLQRNLAAIFMLGGAQGALGWYMVRSGLEVDPNSKEVPRVSPYRLTAHLLSAFALYSGMLWTSLGLLHPKPHAAMASPQLMGIRTGATAAAALAVTTIASGAFVAGNDAGYAYNTWPLMQDQLIPDGLLEMRPAWKNFFENTLTVQFDHRMLAYSTAAVVWGTWLRSRKYRDVLPKRSRVAITAMAHMTTLQVALGITTLLTIVPVPLGVLHQAGGLTMLSLSVWTLHELRRGRIKGALPKTASHTKG